MRPTIIEAVECLEGVARGKYNGNAAEIAAKLRTAIEGGDVTDWDLVSFAIRLARRVRTTNPDDELARKAMDYMIAKKYVTALRSVQEKPAEAAPGG